MKYLCMFLALVLLACSTPTLSVNTMDYYPVCRDIRGTRVKYVQLPGKHNAVAHASSQFIGPAIYWGDENFLSYDRDVQQFILAHECGHHAAGHLISTNSPPFVEEWEADCYAMAVVMDADWFTAESLKKILRLVIGLESDGVAHLPGVERAALMITCPVFLDL